MSDTVNHHFIPRFYLRGFSDAADKRKAQVFVFDQSTRKSFRTLVRHGEFEVHTRREPCGEGSRGHSGATREGEAVACR
ncbi:DUF4238 domain-containing protein [Rhizobium hidalgonense]|uniref:DUF4238 domain-containing protein n=1 Tax=Rhizobium hidalgonense TaxID=1538159 RepID=UPI0035C72E25